MLLLLFFLPNSFVTAIGYSLLLLFASQVVVRYQYIITEIFPICFKNSHQRYSIKMFLFKITQYLLKNTCIGVSF